MGRRAVARLVVAVLVVLGGLAGCSAPAPRPSEPASPTAVPPPAIAPGSTGTIVLGDRPFGLVVPAGYDPGRPSSLVVALHGYTSNAEEAMSFFGLAAAGSRGVLVALPEGSQNARGDRFWNAASACCDFDASGVDDVDYLDRVIAAVQQQYAVDPGRVFVVGHSNGGFMALRLACDRADRVAAVASVAGAMDDDVDCAPSRAVSVLQVHGDADRTILIDGGSINGERYLSAAGITGLWRVRDACPAGEPSAGPPLDADLAVPGDDLTVSAWPGCAQGTEVALWTITDGSHVPAFTPEFTGALLDWFEANARR